METVNGKIRNESRLPHKKNPTVPEGNKCPTVHVQVSGIAHLEVLRLHGCAQEGELVRQVPHAKTLKRDWVGEKGDESDGSK